MRAWSWCCFELIYRASSWRVYGCYFPRGLLENLAAPTSFEASLLPLGDSVACFSRCSRFLVLLIQPIQAVWSHDCTCSSFSSGSLSIAESRVRVFSLASIFSTPLRPMKTFDSDTTMTFEYMGTCIKVLILLPVIVKSALISRPSFRLTSPRNSLRSCF